MNVRSGDRQFSDAQHKRKRWNTAPLRTRTPFVKFIARKLSFKHSELYRFATECETGDLIVELGSGNGSRASDLLDTAHVRLVVLDWSYTALLAATKKSARLMAVCADAGMLPFKNRIFDGVFSVDMLGHVRNVEAVLDEVNRVLRPCGRLFFHSECADYKKRWPDRMLIKKTGTDSIANLDGHTGIIEAGELRKMYERTFLVSVFYSPAGITGWLTGYPEKYAEAFGNAGCRMLYMLTSAAAMVKKLPGITLAVRAVNLLFNKIELFLGLSPGGSCFARMRAYPARTDKGVDPSVDCVIATLSRPESAAHLADALLCQCTLNDRIIVVWQGEQPPDTGHDRRIRLIHQNRKNLPEARNRGARAGGNQVVLFLDDDCEVAENLFDQHRKMYRDEKYGAVAGYIDDPLFDAGGMPFSVFNPETGEIRQCFNGNENGESVTLMGAHMSMRRSVLEAVGGFDGNYRGNAVWEDVDISFKIQNSGYTIGYCANAKVKHLRSENGGCRADGALRHVYNYLANTFYFMATFASAKHVPGWLRYWWYRLEFMSRKQNGAGKTGHSPALVLSGICGMVFGIVRFVVSGKRQGLPVQVGLLFKKVTGDSKC